SEYIREEILEDFDVTAVFVKRDADYYEFKPEIETREQIREVAGEADAKVIAQLERWWDKYRVSLNALDVQVLEAEKVMRGYLRELGYE
ncbi:MAG TPA: type I restriction endonuclease subunit M, partial [Pusillimonas sp.]|nr:type I restriction endonuclease subunit M [Pusillimonas sp.]